MADELFGNIDFGATLNSAKTGVASFFVYFMIIVVLVLLVLVILNLMKYKHRFVVKELTNGVERIREDKAKIVVDKADGIEKWKLLKFKKLAPQPPTDAISLTAKGNFFVEAYYSEEGGFEYVFPHKLASQVSTDKLTTNQKIFTTHEFKKAELDKPKGLTDILNIVMPYAAIAMIIIFGVIMISSWEDITKPMVQMAATNAQVTSDLKQIMQSQENILFKLQSIEGETGGG